ncbi:MAG: ABC transporter permease [Candidatus Limivivens sp.]|nr:ABC transporter permease [Candidatus Limivivens sp.]
MAKYITKRILTAIPLLFVITVLCFALMNLAPYDAIDTMIKPGMSEEVIALMRAKYGYDKPAYVQYISWLQGIFQGELGYSIVTKQSIALDLLTRIPNTIKLVLPSYLTAYVLSIILGLVAGSHKNKWQDKLIDGIASVGIATPTFWVAMLLLYIFGYKLRILPTIGMHTVGMEDSILDFLKHFIMPYLVLIVGFMPDLLRYVRSSTITQFSEDYVMVQNAFGASRTEIMFKHVCKNVLLPVITKLGMAMPMLITGAIITETIFSWPGVGPYFTTAVGGMDYPVVMVILLLSSTMVILGNLLSDILCCLTDPRIKEMG